MSAYRVYTVSKRRRKLYIKKVLIVLSAFLFVSGLGISLGSNLVSAQDNHVDTSLTKHHTVQTSVQKCYKSIQIARGDTLWDIAKKYRTNAYDSTKEYIQEIKEVNELLEDDIHEGQYLTIPYYKVFVCEAPDSGFK